jgi:hypothetical protein
MRRRSLGFFVLVATLVPAMALIGHGAGAQEPGTARNFELVGHNALFARGMNAAPAIYRDFAYVGSRTDGGPGHEHAGVLVLNIKDPSRPRVVGEIGRPHEGVTGITSRELRVWPEKKLLMVMNFNCSSFIHACTPVPDEWNIKFYDLSGKHARNPKLISTYVPSAFPHEMFLWQDPSQPDRALLYISTPTNDVGPPNLVVTDISRARAGDFDELVTFSANSLYTPEKRANFDVALHSMGVSVDGKRTYLAYLGGGFLVLDSSELANGVDNPAVKLLTPVTNSPSWPNQTVHSAVKVPGRDLVVTTDEIYGDLLDDFAFEDHGCPWGWAHLIDISNEARPRVVGQYRTAQNTATYCRSEAGQDPANTVFTSYSAHNPTVLRNLAFVTWHSSGLQAFSLHDPSNPRRTGFFSPQPLVDVDTEDPALSQGLNKVVTWSYPIIKDGLIYVTDIRNGFYVLRYTGPRAAEVSGIDFLEGNSNLGDAVRLEQGG